MDLSKLALCYSETHVPGNRFLNSRMSIVDTETRKPIIHATRCVIELGAEGYPQIVGLEVLDLDENRGQRRDDDGSGLYLTFGVLAGVPLKTHDEVMSDRAAAHRQVTVGTVAELMASGRSGGV